MRICSGLVVHQQQGSLCVCLIGVVVPTGVHVKPTGAISASLAFLLTGFRFQAPRSDHR